jgi:hypothetical protein
VCTGLQTTEPTKSADGSLAERGFERDDTARAEKYLTPSGLLMEDAKAAKAAKAAKFFSGF